MDELLPSEMLAKVASYLSYKDANSLFLTSKTCHSKLKKLLPKIPLNVEISSTSNQIYLRVEVIFEDKASSIKESYLVDQKGPDELTKEEQIAKVVRFYRANLDDVSRLEDIFWGGRNDHLALHLQTIQIFGSIETMRIQLDDDDKLLCAELARVVLASRCRIDNLSISSNSVHQSQMDMIVACKPRYLTMNVHQLPEEFYKLSVVHMLLGLNDFSREKTVHNFCSLSANKLQIIGNHGITIDDFRQFMRQWAESKREISEITLNLNETLSEEDIMVWMEQLDGQLVRVEPPSGHETSWILTRRPDATQLSLSLGDVYHSVIEIYLAK